MTENENCGKNLMKSAAEETCRQPERFVSAGHSTPMSVQLSELHWIHPGDRWENRQRLFFKCMRSGQRNGLVGWTIPYERSRSSARCSWPARTCHRSSASTPEQRCCTPPWGAPTQTRSNHAPQIQHMYRLFKKTRDGCNENLQNYNII